MSRILIPLIFGLLGTGVLVSLGTWQMQRLAWKQGILSRIDARIAAEPVALPDAPTEVADEYTPVQVSGVLDGAFIRVLVSQKHVGAGYKIVAKLDADAGPILLDLGFIPVASDLTLPAGTEVATTGNLHWPDEITRSTPAPDIPGNLWFARDVAAMAQTLGTRPILVVARDMSLPDSNLTPLPVDSASIPNDHLQYAITWFSLAAIWLIMTFYFIWRTRAVRT